MEEKSTVDKGGFSRENSTLRTGKTEFLDAGPHELCVSMWSQLCSPVPWSSQVCTQPSVSSEVRLPPSSLVSSCGQESTRPCQPSVTMRLAFFPFTPSSSHIELTTSPVCVFLYTLECSSLCGKFISSKLSPHLSHFLTPSKWGNMFSKLLLAISDGQSAGATGSTSI